MSYDIWTEAEQPDGEEDERVGSLGWNYTWNVQPMTAKAGLPSLNMLDGVPAPVAALALDMVINRMADAPSEYRKLNPANGWGDYDRFLERLVVLRDHLLLVPKATVRVG